MPYTYRVTWFFSGLEQGWSESFALQRDSLNLRTLNTELEDPVQKRSRLLAKDYTLVAQRIAVVLDLAGLPMRRVGDLAEPRLRGVQAWASATPNMTLLVEWQNGGADRSKNQYMRGIPAGLGDLGKTPNRDFGAWLTNWNAWTAAMRTLRAGWLGSEVNKTWTLTNWVTAVNTGITTFTVPAEDPLWPTNIGFPFRAHISVPGGSSLDGTHVVVPATDTSVYTAKALPAAPHVAGAVGIMQYRTPVFYTIRSTDVAVPDGSITGVRIISRDTGRPTVAGRGRRPAIVRY